MRLWILALCIAKIIACTEMRAGYECNLLTDCITNRRSRCVPMAALQNRSRVLFVGNSLTIRNGLWEMVERLGREAGMQTFSSLSAAASMSFASHVNSAHTQAMIDKGGWDAVVFQEQSSRFAAPPWQYRRVSIKAAGALQDRARSNAHKTVLFETWGYRWGQPSVWNGFKDDFSDMTRRIAAGYAETRVHMAGPGENVQIAPVGRAFEMAFPKFETRLFHRDGVHPAVHGSYLAACVLFSTLYNTSSEALVYRPSGISARDAEELRHIGTAAAFAL